MTNLTPTKPKKNRKVKVIVRPAPATFILETVDPIVTPRPKYAFIETVDNKLRVNLHDGQIDAMESEARFILVLAGTQSGKTSFGPFWLWREIKRRGPGDYLFVTPTYTLLSKKALPEFRRLFERYLALGRYDKTEKTFTFSEDGFKRTFPDLRPSPDNETRVMFGYAADPESLESATAKGAVLDECGQRRFNPDSWDAIQRRLSLYEGRALLTTTPYNMGWLYNEVYLRAMAGDPDYHVTQFASIMNPIFPIKEFLRRRREMPEWKFNMQYLGQFERPAGLIYDSFKANHVIRPFRIPSHWPRFLGLDFGGVNFAGVFIAQEPGTKRLFAYREYWEGNKTAAGHARDLLAGEAKAPYAVGGAYSEGQWRRELTAAGLKVHRPPIKDVEVGIDRVWGCFARNEFFVFNNLRFFRDQLATYSRVVDLNGDPTEEIEDKSEYHILDAVRYIVAMLRHETDKKKASAARR